MNDLAPYRQALLDNGFAVVDDIYSEAEVEAMLSVINSADTSKETFRKSADLFAIRQFLKELPEISRLVFNARLKSVVHQLLGDDFFVVKSIYFDKPPASNWYVPYHQDLTISVDKKTAVAGFGPWTTKQSQFAVQPPVEILEAITTIRIHLDDTDEDNGALRVIPQSHRKQIYRPETIDWSTETETCCAVEQGGIMLMKPLTLHSSGRTTNSKRRRVIHIELANVALPPELKWAERLNLV